VQHLSLNYGRHDGISGFSYFGLNDNEPSEYLLIFFLYPIFVSQTFFELENSIFIRMLQTTYRWIDLKMTHLMVQKKLLNLEFFFKVK
jgi:hypothetical protein